MVCFHGFGDDATSFHVLQPSLRDRYTVVSVDLPFHGKTKWKTGEPFTPQQAIDLVSDLMRSHNVEQVALAAFSIGGKIALKVFEMNPGNVEELWLYAPDGLKNNIWYNIAVYPAWGRKLFRLLLDEPKFLIGLVDVLKALRVLPKSLAQFLKHNLKQLASRERVWNTWIGIKGFEVQPGRLKQVMKESNTHIHIVMGQHDPVIKPRIGRAFVNGVPNADLRIIPKGHYILKPYLNDVIVQILNR
jgi:pimeloyl-ACP methyl ester carboxylesterase